MKMFLLPNFLVTNSGPFWYKIEDEQKITFIQMQPKLWEGITDIHKKDEKDFIIDIIARDSQIYTVTFFGKKYWVFGAQ